MTPFQTAMASRPVPLAQIAETGTVLSANKQLCELLGFGDGELQGKSIQTLMPSIPWPLEHVSHTAGTHPPSVAGEHLQTFVVQRTDGSTIAVRFTALQIQSNPVPSFAVAIQNVADRIEIENQVFKKNEQLSRLNQELLQFAYSTSHDLKAPLASISGLLGFCELDVRSGNHQEVLENLSKSKKLVEQLARRIEDMLRLAQTDIEPNHWETIDVAEQVQSTWNMLGHGGIELRTNFQHANSIRTVLVRFSVILENLLSNAIKFRDSNRAKCEVKVSTRNDETGFQISVQDNGIGIPAEHHSKIFNLFQRVSDAYTPGSGLGLALVKKNALLLGGAVSFTSEPGNTTFTVTLPQDES